MTALQEIVNNHDKVAFLIGNGPNLAAEIMPSWIELLKSAADSPIDFDLDGLSNTEVYDLVELSSNNNPNFVSINSDVEHDMKERVKNKLELQPEANIKIHRRLMEFAKKNDSPVLTTNFDEAFEKSINAQLFILIQKGLPVFTLGRRIMLIKN